MAALRHIGRGGKSMTVQQRTLELATVLRQLLPPGAYDNSPGTLIAKDIYAHALALAQAEQSADQLLDAISSVPPALLNEYEQDLSLPPACAGKLTLAQRQAFIDARLNEDNVQNIAYLQFIFNLFGVVVKNVTKYRPMQCTASCTSAVNTEQLRYRVRLTIQPTSANVDCIIKNYFPAYLRYDIVQEP